MRKALAILAVIALSSCGGGDSSTLTVSAASSLKQAFTDYQPDNRYSFAGSDQLAAQIQAGAKPDVFAAANTKLPAQLYAKGLVEKPKVFATNKLVLAVAPNSKIAALSDLARPGVKIAMGAPDVPAGSYARQVLSKLDPKVEKAILANVKSNEPDVAGVVGKVSQGAVDAGFVYITDVKAANERLKAVQLPRPLEPQVAYAAAVVKGSKHHSDAEKFIDGLAGASALTDAGFGRP